MVSYIEENLLPGEEIVYRGHRHWIVFLAPILWLVSGVLFLAGVVALKKLALIPFIVGLIMSINAFIDYCLSEMAVTNKRVLAKIGFIRRASVEAPLQNVASTQVDQGFWGRILNYGSVTLCDVGRVCLPFHRISSPLEFKRYVQREIDKNFPQSE